MVYPLFVPIPYSGYRRNVMYPYQPMYYQYQNYQPSYYRYAPLQSNIMVGALPDNFLQISEPEGIVPSPMPVNQASTAVTSPQSQEERDRETAIRMQNEIIAEARNPVVGRLEVSIVNAVLNKNYGISRMDPYVRLRVGHLVYETHTHPNGAKAPTWNKTFQVYHIPRGVKSFSVEVYDERTLTEDELIAWANIPIPENVFKGETINEWFKLSGKLGEAQEGSMNIVLSYGTGPAPAPAPMMLPSYAGYAAQVPVYTMPPAHPVYANVSPQHRQASMQTPAPTPVAITEEDIKQLQEMFPDIEVEVIKSVIESTNGNKEHAINSLLQMQ